MNYCLNKPDFDEFFDLHLNEISINHLGSEDLKLQLENCFNWEDKVGILVYLFTHYLQKKTNDGDPFTNDKINLFFNLENDGLFQLEMIDREFVSYMFNYSRSKINEDLSDTLLIILQNYIDRSYDSSLCF